MKKIVFLLIASLVLVSCGRDNEPIGPIHNNGSSSSNSSSNSGGTNDNKQKIGYINFVNVSYDNKYKCYVNNKEVVIVSPRKSFILKCNAGSYKIRVEQYDNIYNDKMAVYEDNIIVYNNATHKAEFPYLDNLVLINESNDDYYVTINDGMYEVLVDPVWPSVINNLDVYATYKIYVVQKNGYLFFPTKKTYYYTMNNSGNNILEFNP